MDESGTDWAECSRKVANGGRVAGAIRSLINARDLQLECARVLRETLLIPVLMYGSETVLWKEKKRSRIRAVQMNNLRGLLGISKMDRIPNVQIREFGGVTKGGSALWRQWGMIGVCAGFRSVGRPRKR